MKSHSPIPEGFAILSAFRLPLLWSTASALLVVAATATAHAACVEDGIARYRNGGLNDASYLGHTGDKCKTLVDGGKDPVIGIISVNANIAGKVEVIDGGWTYTFGPKKEAYPEVVRMAVLHKSGARTTFDIKANCIDR